MKATGSSSKFWSWTYIAGGSAAMLMALSQAVTSFAAGTLQFSSSKYGFTAHGMEAAVIYGAVLIGSALIIGFGWRGLRHGRQDT
jgi:hypothetical protein